MPLCKSDLGLKVSINRKPVDGPYGGGNLFIRQLIKTLSSAGHHVVHTPDHDSDCIFICDPRPSGDGYSINDAIGCKSRNPNLKIIQRINECDARKNTEHMDQLLLQCSRLIDHTIFVSNWMRDYFLKKGWQNNSFSVLHNGVSQNYLDIQRSAPSPTSSVLSIVTHHWSNNVLKGFDAYDFIDYLCGIRDDIRFTYIGRHRNSFSNTTCINPLSGHDLAIELSRHDIYVSGSRFDPGPNHVLEALAVGLPTYVHNDGGGAVEFAGKNMSFKNFVELESIINKASHEQNIFVPLEWDKALNKIHTVLESLSLGH